MAFSDDLAIVGTAEDTTHLNRILETAASKAIQWLQEVGLQIAPQKSEVIVLTKKKAPQRPGRGNRREDDK